MTLDLSQFPVQSRLTFHFKGTVSTQNDLPECGEVGDVIQVVQWRVDRETVHINVNVVWDGEKWIKLDPIAVD